MIYGYVYTITQRLLHCFNLHYMPPCYPEGDTVVWCRWCGVRDVVKRASFNSVLKSAEGEE